MNRRWSVSAFFSSRLEEERLNRLLVFLNLFRSWGATALVALVIFSCGVCRAQQGYVGAYFQFMDPMTASQFGLTQGATVVQSVVHGSPAESSGLRSGDIITSVDGVPMRSPAEVAGALRSHKPGSKASVGIIHPMGAKNMSIEIMVSIGTPPVGSTLPGPGIGVEQPLPRNNGERSGSGGSSRPITDAQKAYPVQQGPCRAVLPLGWQLVPGQDGQTAEIYGPNGARVSWGIVGINPAMRSYYGDIYGPPEVHAAAVASAAVHSQVRFFSSQTIGGFYTVHEFQGGNAAGVMLYHVFAAPIQGQYIITDYLAFAPQSDARLLSQAAAVMTSLQCVSRVHPPEPSSTGSRSRGSRSQESDALKDYNSTLGTQYAHDSAGTNYYLDRASQWRDSGPDGPGYYKGTGVNMEKLTPGLE